MSKRLKIIEFGKDGFFGVDGGGGGGRGGDWHGWNGGGGPGFRFNFFDFLGGLESCVHGGGSLFEKVLTKGGPDVGAKEIEAHVAGHGSGSMIDE